VISASDFTRKFFASKSLPRRFGFDARYDSDSQNLLIASSSYNKVGISLNSYDLLDPKK
jgi:hypothetical protein